jgi:hypothetical protein
MNEKAGEGGVGATTDKKYKPCALISTSMILKMFFIILTFTRPLTFKKMFVK